MQRDRLASALSWLSPPAKVERVFQSLAGTDTRAAAAYETRVRNFHATLRTYYYPHLFRGAPFEARLIAERPEFAPGTEG